MKEDTDRLVVLAYVCLLVALLVLRWSLDKKLDAICEAVACEVEP